jgi:hypothetical protein
MKNLSRGIVDAIILEYGHEEFLRRLSNPFFFQSFGCILGFDWHSSGVTTTLCGALKEALTPEEHGIAVCGGKGRVSRKTPEEITKKGESLSLNTSEIDRLVYASRISAKVDNAVLQDNYNLYQHTFIFTEKGEWCVIQQGMNPKNRYARRYHWLSDNVKSFIEEPHSAVCCDSKGIALDMTAKKSEAARKISLDVVKDGPERIKNYVLNEQKSLTHFLEERQLTLSPVHQIRKIDMSKRGWTSLKKAYEIQPQSYEELVSITGIGPKIIRTLALLAEVIYGEEPSWEDPVKYSFAHGGKDGIPYPVDRELMDKSIEVLRTGVEEAKLNQKEKLNALKRLSNFIKFAGT